MEDVLEVYAREYNAEYPVVCYDESPKQLVSELRKSYMDDKGIKYEDCEYQREGAAEIVMIVEPLGQHREIFIDDDHKGDTWARHMGYIAEQMYPNAKKVTVVEDNLSSHKKHNLYNTYTMFLNHSVPERLLIKLNLSTPPNTVHGLILRNVN